MKNLDLNFGYRRIRLKAMAQESVSTPSDQTETGIVDHTIFSSFSLTKYLLSRGEALRNTIKEAYSEARFTVILGGQIENTVKDSTLLSYRHGFHAGNFADLLKHVIQVEILRYLALKDKPFDYIDTHAGAGIYRLTSTAARKNAEFETGIGLFRPHDEQPIDELTPYLAEIDKHNPGRSLTLYPGSPAIAAGLMRPYDKAWLFELHSTDADYLQQNLPNKRQIKIRQEDGYLALPGLLPTQSRRAFVLIDPPYEIKTDYRRVFETVKLAHKRMPNATFAVWYPVVDRRRIQDMHRHFKHCGIRNISVFELGIRKDEEGFGMTSSGMIVVNPPWTLMANMNSLLPKLAKRVSVDDELHWHSEQLVAE